MSRGIKVGGQCGRWGAAGAWGQQGTGLEAGRTHGAEQGGLGRGRGAAGVGERPEGGEGPLGGGGAGFRGGAGAAGSGGRGGGAREHNGRLCADAAAGALSGHRPVPAAHRVLGRAAAAPGQRGGRSGAGHARRLERPARRAPRGSTAAAPLRPPHQALRLLSQRVAVACVPQPVSQGLAILAPCGNGNWAQRPTDPAQGPAQVWRARPATGVCTPDWRAGVGGGAYMLCGETALQAQLGGHVGCILALQGGGGRHRAERPRSCFTAPEAAEKREEAWRS